MLEEVPGVPLQGLRAVFCGRLDEAGVDVGLQKDRERTLRVIHFTNYINLCQMELTIFNYFGVQV